MKKLLILLTAGLFVGSFAFSAHHKKSDILDVAVKTGSFKTLVAAVKAAGLVDALRGKGPFTVFAPTDEAFSKLPKGTVEKLLRPENKQQLTDILLYHVVSGRVEAETAVKLDSAKTLQGSNFKISLEGKTLKIDTASVIKANIGASNGIIHVIDSVIIPGQIII